MPTTDTRRTGSAQFERNGIMLLAGPVVAYGYFWFVYLLAETACAPGHERISATALRGVTIASALVAGLPMLLFGIRLRRRSHRETADDAGDVDEMDGRRERRFVARLSNALLALFLFFVVLVASSAVASMPC